MYELGVRAILKDSLGRILLVKNLHGIHADKWVLPGGRVDKGELAKEAIKREVLEEVNLVFDPKFLTYSEDISSNSTQYYLTLFFTGKFSGTISIQGGELGECRFFTADEIAQHDNIGFGHKEVILGVI